MEADTFIHLFELIAGLFIGSLFGYKWGWKNGNIDTFVHFEKHLPPRFVDNSYMEQFKRYQERIKEEEGWVNM